MWWHLISRWNFLETPCLHQLGPGNQSSQHPPYCPHTVPKIQKHRLFPPNIITGASVCQQGRREVHTRTPPGFRLTETAPNPPVAGLPPNRDPLPPHCPPSPVDQAPTSLFLCSSPASSGIYFPTDGIYTTLSGSQVQPQSLWVLITICFFLCSLDILTACNEVAPLPPPAAVISPPGPADIVSSSSPLLPSPSRYSP